ncbi:unnamed protein product [Bursaphelenchus xylophilus]|uniref:(pine wood nematode) hypothetical protein n=1 Tax=Bursaphelenchus xylophilus TaxID=6326 RepID=A0A1I7SCV0_BURXY|nr:unnamed protein product [Bursaphelenchus xylophilus]CAG9093439.1 unnamed protein product [Bursaphelenchus xylophilus]
MVRGRKKVSAAWPHFEPISHTKKFRCRHCNLHVVGPGCSNLKKHLQAKHKEIFFAIDELDKSAAESGISYAESSMDISIRSDSGLANSERNSEEDEGDLSFAKFVCQALQNEEADENENRPFNLFDMMKEKSPQEAISDFASSLVISNLNEQCETLKDIVEEKNRTIAELTKENEALKLLVQQLTPMEQ